MDEMFTELKYVPRNDFDKNNSEIWNSICIVY